MIDIILRSLKRLIDISMWVITPLPEQLTKPLPNAMALVKPEGTTNRSLQAFARRYAIGLIHHIQFLNGIHRDDLVINAGTNAGAHLVDAIGDSVLLESLDQDFDFLRNTSFNLLQCCRMRNTKTEYVQCPSCDLQEISAQIREKTSHLPSVSVITYCNHGLHRQWPRGMADVDFGYVGGAPGKIDLYVGKTVVKRGIAMEHAADALIQLIKDHGRWVDTPAEE
ncbi:4-hydroxy-3-methylbut-2-en-1-yl diphosphate synthase (ferredoxin), chloroplastic [Gossypium australe]|uniref:4-hydroxy-3-methylbut-2-en-1-yl diphosphate synthase (Ferredoxin), chloroplastic n=1 Tax=Gossypium australe TaxID=47621 RepID=A0A5B6X5S8_9ROSI|nr:4-hydroxy-3-methylbut-2-en-1-yl diphosphate synthase (ferredoxin), chloroplastic [Gossypium australe]